MTAICAVSACKYLCLVSLYSLFDRIEDSMTTDLDTLVASACTQFAQAVTPNDLENAKARFLGKAGQITERMKGLAQLSVEEKKTRGAAINQAKQAIEAALAERRQQLAEAELNVQLQAEALDVTLPGRQCGAGGLHPVTLTLERIEGIFGSMGFEVAQGPEIESDWSACRRFASSRRAAPTAWTATPPIRPCFTSAKAYGSAKTSASRI